MQIDKDHELRDEFPFDDDEDRPVNLWWLLAALVVSLWMWSGIFWLVIWLVGAL